MGVLSIATYTSKHTDARFTILDLNMLVLNSAEEFINKPWDVFLREKILASLKGISPSIVGISAIFNSNTNYLYSIAATIRELFPETIIVAGGGVPTNMTEHVFNSAPMIDGIAVGEGEKPFAGLVMAEDKKIFLAKAPGWMTKERLLVKLDPTMDLITDLDDIPFLRYDLIDFKEYQIQNRYHGERSSENIIAPIMTSRGCPYRCSFCASFSVHGRKMRFYSVDRILNDIRRLKEEFNVKILVIEDDQFLFDKNRAIKILEGIAAHNLIIEFPNGLSVADLNEELIVALKKAGLKMASLAVESGCERVLNKIIHKPYRTLDAVRNIVALMRKEQLYIRAFFIIGFPGETKEEILESIHFMKSAGFNWVAIMLASPIAGSELYEICQKQGLLMSTAVEDFHYAKSNILLDHSTPEEMENLRYHINLDVNFVNNYDLIHGQPQTALIGFLDVLGRMDDHAFACYYAAQSYQSLGDHKQAEMFFQKYYTIIYSSKFWADQAKYFGLPLIK
ncbi:MAG: B12-binding domain-containing radical SAM protein [Candidatus Omnitrophica bacterium]|nr:B12-binding domain-containing radical SAM protein [Candidatus Omnitrophota bacterium]